MVTGAKLASFDTTRPHIRIDKKSIHIKEGMFCGKSVLLTSL